MASVDVRVASYTGPVRARPRSLASGVLAALLLTSACNPLGDDAASSAPGDTPGAEASAPDDSPVITASVDDGATEVPVDTAVTSTVEGGSYQDVSLVGTVDGRQVPVEGTVDGDEWHADDLLEPGASYTLTATATSPDGGRTSLSRSFTTQALSLDQQTYASVAPLDGETVGVGMPVVVSFDLPVKDRALFEQHMSVTVEGQQVAGSWHWYSDTSVHYRPQQYWPAHATIHVDLDVNGLPTGNGTYGQESRRLTFRTGEARVTRVNVARHKMVYTVDGRTIRTFKVTTGDDQHRTRRGVKVIMEKFSTIDMDAATTGVDSQDPDYYNIKGVRWAMRLTTSGEFIHAAPWSAASQGRDNVSHGCTGMSLADSKWLFQHSRRGDVVEYVNSPRPLETQNGWTDWNVDWDDWTSGSSLADAQTAS